MDMKRKARLAALQDISGAMAEDMATEHLPEEMSDEADPMPEEMAGGPEVEIHAEGLSPEDVEKLKQILDGMA